MRGVTMKGIIGVITGLAGYFLGCINETVVILAVLIVCDYLTGVIASIYTDKKYDWKQGIKGAVKKCCYAFVILIGFVSDYILSKGIADIGVDLNTKGKIGTVVVLYLIGTEGFSILQNLVKIGVPVPEKLKNFFSKIA